MRYAATCLLSLSLFGTLSASAGERRVVGQTFPIAEPDLMAEIKQRVAGTDWNAVTRRKNPASFSAFKTAPLPLAAKDRTYLVDPTYTLTQAVVDAKGVVLYPAGTTINVYERRKFPGRTIVIGPDPKHFRWLDEVVKPTDIDKVLLAGAHMLEVRELVGARKVFALEARAVERFGLQAIPCIVKQEGTLLRVTEYAIR